MTTHSKSCITHSLPEAERMVDQLRAARFSPDEISMLVPVETPVLGTAPHDGGLDREHDGSYPETRTSSSRSIWKVDAA